MPRVSGPVVRQLTWIAPLLMLLVCALAFPRSGAGGVACLALVAASGVGLERARRRITLAWPRWAPDALVALVVAVTSLTLFRDTWNQSGLRAYDWAPHHANLRHLVEGLQRGSVPRWVHGVSTGDSPYELYPLLPYWLMARAALLAHTSDLTLVLVRTAIVTHTLAALGGGLLARRLVRSVSSELGGVVSGALVGFVMLYDVGSVYGGGVDGLFKLGVLHAALANAVFPFALVAVLEALRRPTLVTSASTWLSVALAILCHPLALTSALATVLGLIFVALLARDVPARRALACAAHVVLGVALVAWSFVPLNARLLTYGVHFSVGGTRAWEHFAWLTAQPIPQATLAPLVFAGNFGVVAALVSRRAAPTLLGAFAGALLAFLIDQPYTLLHLIPSLEGVRFQTVRLASASKATIYALGCYVLVLAWQRARAVVVNERARAVLAALSALGAALLLRSAVPYFDQLGTTLGEYAHYDVPDEAGLRELAVWARKQQRTLQPGRFARLLHEDERRFYSVYHVNALSGLPTLWLGSVPCLFLRERIEDASAASLRRFDVRWVMRRDEPPSLGDPDTEQRFGHYFVRELREWDGAFARIERGSGHVAVTRLEDERIDVDVTDTTESAFVVLGMGYYPRWQAVHEKLGALPVYAEPSIRGGELSVPAAWLPPGRTTFRPTGALPSDGRGRFVSIAAFALAVGGMVAWGLARARAFVLRKVARAIRFGLARRRQLGMAALGVFSASLVIAGGIASTSPVTALGLGSGLRGTARVDSLSADGKRHACQYSFLYGGYRCRVPSPSGRVAHSDGLFVQDSTADLLNDAPPSFPFSVPAIVMGPASRDAVVRIELDARLAGEYWAAADGGEVRLTTGDGEVTVALGAEQQTLRFAPRAASRRVTLEASIPARKTLRVAVVAQDRLEPDRRYPRAPAAPPAR